MTREDFKKYHENMIKIYDNEKKTLVKIDGLELIAVYDCFGHCNENNDIIYDIEGMLINGNYINLKRVNYNRLTFI